MASARLASQDVASQDVVGDGLPAAAAAPAPDAFAEERWKRRPMLGRLVRVLALAVPIAASVLAAVAVSRAVQRPSSLAGAAGWWLMLVVISTLVLAVVDRAARRLLPLAALLRLSMLFPDHAPSRFSVAFKAGTTRNLREKLALAKEQGVADEPARAAEQVLVLVAAMNTHHRGTRGHSERVRAFNDLITEELRLPERDRDRLRWAALLHDVGKLEVPARILDKPGKPTEAEWDTLRLHPRDGARMVAPLNGWLGPWAAAIEQHHERWDGAGYPLGLAGQKIGLAARIVAVADVFEVMTAPRPYRRPVNAEAARAELARCAGSQLDPVIVRAFLNVSLGKLRLAMGPLSWLAQLPFVGALPRVELASAGRAAATVAGTATGVGALALIGVVSPPTSDDPVSVDAQAAQSSTGVVPLPPGPSGAPRTATAPQTGTQPGSAGAPVGTGRPSSAKGGTAVPRDRQGTTASAKRRANATAKRRANAAAKRKANATAKRRAAAADKRRAAAADKRRATAADKREASSQRTGDREDKGNRRGQAIR